MKIVLYAKTGCPRSEAARKALLEARGGAAFELIEKGPAEAARHHAGSELPVVEIDGRKALDGDVTAAAVEAELRRIAGAARPKRSPKKAGLVPLLVIGLVVTGAVVSKAYEIFAEPKRLSLLHIGLEPLERPAPRFELTDHDGKAVRLEDFRGKWVFLNFWATWCESCRYEMPSMTKLAQKLAGDDFVMVAASVDDDWTPINAYFAGKKTPFVVLHDADAKAAHLYGTQKFPETYIIGPDGQLRAKFTGPRDWEEEAFSTYFRDLLGRPIPGAARQAANP